jgi:hypothetical protein
MPISTKFGEAVIRQRGVSSTLAVHTARASATDKWRYTYEIEYDPDGGPGLNPQTTTDASGGFTVIVPRSLFRESPDCRSGCAGYKAGELGLGVFDGLVSSYEIVMIKYGVDAPDVDVGRLVLKPVRDATS